MGMRVNSSGHDIAAAGIDHISPRWCLQVLAHCRDLRVDAEHIGQLLTVMVPGRDRYHELPRKGETHTTMPPRIKVMGARLICEAEKWRTAAFSMQRLADTMGAASNVVTKGYKR